VLTTVDETSGSVDKGSVVASAGVVGSSVGAGLD